MGRFRLLRWLTLVSVGVHATAGFAISDGTETLFAASAANGTCQCARFAAHDDVTIGDASLVARLDALERHVRLLFAAASGRCAACASASTSDDARTSRDLGGAASTSGVVTGVDPARPTLAATSDGTGTTETAAAAVSDATSARLGTSTGAAFGTASSVDWTSAPATTQLHTAQPAATTAAAATTSTAPPSGLPLRPFGWGYNSEGEVGDGSQIGRNTAVAVALGLQGNVTATLIAAGYFHSLVALSNGTLWGWGINPEGQIGDNTKIRHPAPSAVLLPGLAASGVRVAAIAAGEYHSLALLTNNTLYAWGLNSQGQCGDRTYVARLVPNPVFRSVAMSRLNVTAIAAGSQHSVFLLSDGTVYCFGLNQHGQLGLSNSLRNSNAPTLVSTSSWNPRVATAIAAGHYHTVALLSDGSLAAWGRNIEGQVGQRDGTANDAVPGIVIAGGVSAIAAGGDITLALMASGAVHYLGRPTTDVIRQPTPKNLATAPFWAEHRVIQLAAGGAHAMMLTETGSILAWGDNGHGQLGTNISASTYSNPQLVQRPADWQGRRVVAVSGGKYHSLALVSSTD